MLLKSVRLRVLDREARLHLDRGLACSKRFSDRGMISFVIAPRRSTSKGERLTEAAFQPASVSSHNRRDDGHVGGVRGPPRALVGALRAAASDIRVRMPSP